MESDLRLSRSRLLDSNHIREGQKLGDQVLSDDVYGSSSKVSGPLCLCRKKRVVWMTIIKQATYLKCLFCSKNDWPVVGSNTNDTELVKVEQFKLIFVDTT